MVKVLLVDDHKIILDGLSALLETIDGYEVVATATSGVQAIEYATVDWPDVIIMDIVMPGEFDGVATTRLIKASNKNVKIIALSILSDPTSISAMLKAGADGYLIKNASSDELVWAIESVLEGDIFIHPDLTNEFITSYKNGEIDRKSVLTDREYQILLHIAEGKSTKEIAQLLYRSEETIKSHRKKMLKKFNCANAAALVNYAFRHRLLV